MKKSFNFNFVSKFPIAVIFSIVLLLSSGFILYKLGLNYGVDFRGGAEVQVKFTEMVKLVEVRDALKNNQFSSTVVQSVGEPGQNEYLIKIGASESDINGITEALASMLKDTFEKQQVEIRRTDIVGPKAGERLRVSGFQAMAWALLGIMIYVGLRFDFKYAPGAIVALFHDVFIILGLFSLSGKEFSLQIVGALLAVIGYSVNDTVVVYDRVRENEEKFGHGDIHKSINTALNETLSRTLLTSTTTLIVSLVMFFTGGGVIHDFFFAISAGVLIGTYSSIFVAAPSTIFFDRFQSAK
jgi:preprotein translocase subunit SecF